MPICVPKKIARSSVLSCYLVAYYAHISNTILLLDRMRKVFIQDDQEESHHPYDKRHKYTMENPTWTESSYYRSSMVTTHHRSRTPSPVRVGYRNARANRFPPTSTLIKPPQVPNRRSGGRRTLPATPTQPSTLNLDQLNGTPSASAGTSNFLGVDLFNFPRLETSPTRMKLLLQNLGRKNNHVSSASGQLSEPPMVPRRNIPGRVCRWSRSLDDPITFEEAVIAGRGSRQLPVVGPQQLLGRGRGGGQAKRELPRPGVSSHHHAAFVDSDEEEDWC